MRALVAGIGNIFCGDDAFGVEVVRILQGCELPSGVRVADFGIRSYDLAYAIMDDYDLVILVDAAPRGQSPGTVSLIQPEIESAGKATTELVNAHSMGPARALQLVQSLGGQVKQLYLVSCEPAVLETDALGLSPTVQAAVPQAVELICSLLQGGEPEIFNRVDERTQSDQPESCLSVDRNDLSELATQNTERRKE
jgi:hydrogenase maturation protease